ncbi:MAG: hypothetical protein JO372_18945 [Solirubrobacterales bacterium]|nr:hypothetical protein [Solirubrobacterales bacterium]
MKSLTVPPVEMLAAERDQELGRVGAVLEEGSMPESLEQLAPGRRERLRYGAKRAVSECTNQPLVITARG